MPSPRPASGRTKGMMSCLANNKRVWVRRALLSHTASSSFIQPSINRKPYPLYWGWGMDNNKPRDGATLDRERKKRGKRNKWWRMLQAMGERQTDRDRKWEDSGSMALWGATVWDRSTIGPHTETDPIGPAKKHTQACCTDSSNKTQSLIRSKTSYTSQLTSCSFYFLFMPTCMY